MADYELIEDLKKEGFILNYPKISSNDKKIISILKENDSRLNLAIPLLLDKPFSYKKIIDSVSKNTIPIFNKIILITYEIFKIEKINTSFLKKIIDKFKIKNKFKINELDYFYEEFVLSRKLKKKFFLNKKEFESRESLNILINLEKIFSPAKIRILKKIYQHEKLNPTEERYYYRSVKPLIEAMLNNPVKNFLEIVLKNKRQGIHY